MHLSGRQSSARGGGQALSSDAHHHQARYPSKDDRLSQQHTPQETEWDTATVESLRSSGNDHTPAYRRLLGSVLSALIITSTMPLQSHALISEQPSLMISMDDATTLGNPADAARRLLVDPSPVRPNSIALQQLRQQQDMQDFRLQLCQTQGQDWDQCFFYGPQNMKRQSAVLPPSASLEQMPARNAFVPSSGGNRIPTW